MKSDNMIALALAGVAVYFIMNKTVSTSGKTGVAAVMEKVSEIFESGGGNYANGWRYFTDGTAIDPTGNYYSGGTLIWQNPANFV